MANYFEFHNPVKIVSGNEALETIGYELIQLKSEKPLIITDRVLINLGLVEIVIKALKNVQIEVNDIIDSIPVDSDINIVNTIATKYQSEGYDALIAIGGGSVIDTAKGINMVVSTDVYDIRDIMGMNVIRGPLKPLIAVPSTTGTGSEATMVSVIKDTDAHVKMEFISSKLVPDVAILDPRMTLSLPSVLKAQTAFDALTHSIEAYTCLQKNPVSDAYAISAIKKIRDNLMPSLDEPKNDTYRFELANASLLAGIAFSNSMVGMVHAIGHALGSVCNIPHGQAMAILLPHCMAYNKDLIGNYYGELLFYLTDEETYFNCEKSKRPDLTILKIEGLLKQIHHKTNLKLKLSELGVKIVDFDKVAELAVNDGSALLNPKEVTKEAVIEVLNKAF